MIFWTFKITIISIILIFLIHHLVNFFTATLTVPKLKDLVNKPTEKYESIFNIISNSNNTNSNTNTNSYSKNNPNYTTSELLPISENTTMKNELKDFLKKQLTTTNHTMNKNNQSSMNNMNNINNMNNANSIINTNTNSNNYSPLYSTNDNSYSLFH